MKLVGRELALRYVLEGSMREVANRVAITMQLMHRATPARTRDNLRYSTHLRRIRRNFGFLLARFQRERGRVGISARPLPFTPGWGEVGSPLYRADPPGYCERQVWGQVV